MTARNHPRQYDVDTDCVIPRCKSPRTRPGALCSFHYATNMIVTVLIVVAVLLCAALAAAVL